MTSNTSLKNSIKRTFQMSGLALALLGFSAQAGLWEDTKNAASSAWESTKEVSSDAWDKTKEVSADTWDKTKEVSSDAWDATKEAGRDVKEGAKETWNDATAPTKEEDSGSLSDVSKLAEKETYVKAWEGIKESAANPSAPDVDENGIPKY